MYFTVWSGLITTAPFVPCVTAVTVSVSLSASVSLVRTETLTMPSSATLAVSAFATGASGAAARRQLAVLGLGVAAIVLGTFAGDSEVLARVLEPPFPLGLVLGVAAGLVGIVAVLRAAARIGEAHDDPRELIRAVRLIFLAVGCLAAAAGWVIGSPVPIVAGLIIVGIDVVETTFLLLVTAARGP